MHISVIIPVYNRQKYISRAIDSVLNQTLPASEIIVVDDGSTDDTPLILKSYGNSIKIIEQENKGVSSARNRGIEESKYSWIALLDSDDEWLPNKLKYQKEFHKRFTDYKISQSAEIWIRNGRRVNPKLKHKKYHGYIFDKCLPLCIISPSAVIFKKELLNEIGSFDETLPVCEDYDLWLRVSEKYPVGFDQREGLIKYGGHSDQLSGKYPLMDLYRIKAIEKLLKKNNLKHENRVLALKELLRKYSIVLSGARKRKKQTHDIEDSINKYSEQLDILQKTD